MSLTELSIKKPVVILVGFLVLCLFGLFGYTQLRYELLPKFNTSYIDITTIYPGASPEENETSLTKPIEEAVSLTDGIKHITSTSSEGVSKVFIEYESGVDANEAFEDAQREVNAILSDLPDNAKTPILSKVNANELPILRISATANIGGTELGELLEETIKPRLTQIKGVGEVEFIGLEEREIQVELDAQRMELRGVSPLMGIGSYQAVIATTPQANIERLVRDTGGSQAFVIGFVVCMIAAAVTVEINIAISHWLDRFLKWDEQPLRRAGVQLAVILGLTFTISLIAPRVYFWFAPLPPSLQANRSWAMVKNGIIGMLSTLIGTGIYLAMSFFHHWKTKSLEAEQYKVAAVEAQIEALKSQLDPHFMFNSLNTLTELVEINSSKSLDFLKSFGQFYRYVLQIREHESVTLQEELDFADSYLFLLKTRFGEALQVDKNVAKTALNKHLPPMTLQLLLENAVKHNVLTVSKPLRVSLSTDGQWLTVQNNLQPKSSKPYSSGIGLKNITERVSRLTQQEPIIENGDGVFSVKIPLH